MYLITELAERLLKGQKVAQFVKSQKAMAQFGRVVKASIRQATIERPLSEPAADRLFPGQLHAR